MASVSNNTTHGPEDNFDHGGSNDYELYGDDDFEVLHYIETYFVTPLCIFGILGNLLVIVILSQKKNRMFSSSVFLVSLAVSDIITLVVGQYSYYNKINMSYAVECKVVNYLAYTCVQLSSWCLVAVAFERVTGVLKPMEAKLFWTPNSARKTIFGIVFVLATFNVCFLVSFDLIEFDEFTKVCQPAGRLQYFMENVFPWIDCIVAFVIPSLCIAVTSVIIISKLKGMTRRVRNADNDRRTSITRALLSANIVFMATMAPYGIYEIIQINTVTSGWTGDVLLYVFLTMSQLNASANFYLYFLSGPRFRADVKLFFQGCLCWCCRCISINEVNSQSADISVPRNNSGQKTTSASVPPVNENEQRMESVFVPTVNENGQTMDSVFVPPVNENGQRMDSAFVPPVNEHGQRMESANEPPVNEDKQRMDSAFEPPVNEHGQRMESANEPPVNENGPRMASAFVPPVNENGQRMKSAFEPPVNGNWQSMETAFEPPVNGNWQSMESAFEQPVNEDGQRMDSAFKQPTTENGQVRET